MTDDVLARLRSKSRQVLTPEQEDHRRMRDDGLTWGAINPDSEWYDAPRETQLADLASALQRMQPSNYMGWKTHDVVEVLQNKFDKLRDRCDELEGEFREYVELLLFTQGVFDGEFAELLKDLGYDEVMAAKSPELP